MEESLSKKTVRGVAWSGIERLASQVIQLIVNVLLARILVPEDFGLIAEIMIFIQISQILIDSGFSTALIQRIDRTDTDFCTVFYFNLTISLLLYAVLFFCAPLIADFYNSPQLVDITRVVSLNFVIAALFSVHKTKLTIEIRFKEQSLISVVAALVSCSCALLMAFNGFGVWALVAQSLSSFMVQAVMTTYITRWMPALTFSWRSFKNLFSYSSKCLGSSLLNQAYGMLYPMIIGRRFSAIELGYYNRGDFFAAIPAQTIGNVISRVAFPIFSSIQNETERLNRAYSKYIQFASAIVFPIMIGLIVLARPGVVVLLTDKWLPSVPMLQILAMAWMLDHLSQINLNVLYVKGRSDLALRLEIIKKSIATALLLGSMFFGIYAICWSRVVYSIIAVSINTHYTRRFIGISRKDQIKDFMPYLLLAAAMGTCTHLIQLPLESDVLKLAVGMPFGVTCYAILLYLFRPAFFKEFISLIKRR